MHSRDDLTQALRAKRPQQRHRGLRFAPSGTRFLQRDRRRIIPADVLPIGVNISITIRIPLRMFPTIHRRGLPTAPQDGPRLA
jgi:hypothetical protein